MGTDVSSRPGPRPLKALGKDQNWAPDGDKAVRAAHGGGLDDRGGSPAGPPSFGATGGNSTLRMIPGPWSRSTNWERLCTWSARDGSLQGKNLPLATPALCERESPA